jgi:hypothetical protein
MNKETTNINKEGMTLSIGTLITLVVNLPTTCLTNSYLVLFIILLIILRPGVWTTAEVQRTTKERQQCHPLCWIACLSVRVEPQINQLKHNYRKRHSRRNHMAPMSIF